ncbi:MAG: hypothetical protein HY848_04085 [Betaproteobacteria bacterium]|nr:hypothetical protein [Betaproteobacteria bacterium]
MRRFLIILGFALATSAHASNSPLPPEVAAFIQDRDACDHFRGEPYEGNSPGQNERRGFILESLKIHCPGTDRRLAALRKRYKHNAEVMRRLNNYEKQIEGKTVP